MEEGGRGAAGRLAACHGSAGASSGEGGGSAVQCAAQKEGAAVQCAVDGAWQLMGSRRVDGGIRFGEAAAGCRHRRAGRRGERMRAARRLPGPPTMHRSGYCSKRMRRLLGAGCRCSEQVSWLQWEPWYQVAVTVRVPVEAAGCVHAAGLLAQQLVVG